MDDIRVLAWIEPSDGGLPPIYADLVDAMLCSLADVFSNGVAFPDVDLPALFTSTLDRPAAFKQATDSHPGRASSGLFAWMANRFA
jgi:hypothetical protein